MATRADARVMLDIYEPIVRATATSFETDPPTLPEFEERIDQTLRQHPWLLCEIDGGTAGYAYGCPFRRRPAYRWTAEVAVYVHRQYQKRGVGGALYRAILACLRLQGYQSVMAGIALPNEASVHLHRRAGFERIGVIRQAGYKLGGWHDISWWQRRLSDDSPPDAEPGCWRDVVRI